MFRDDHSTYKKQSELIFVAFLYAILCFTSPVKIPVRIGELS
jgi:hypothetical protein